jgi:large subunit ribosomal protein L35
MPRGKTLAEAWGATAARRYPLPDALAEFPNLGWRIDATAPGAEMASAFPGRACRLRGGTSAAAARSSHPPARRLRGRGRSAISVPLSPPRGAAPCSTLGVLPAMPKMKTKRAAAKRFGFTGTGKVRRNKANHRHNMTGKPQQAKVSSRGTAVAEPGDARLIKLMLPYGV